MSCPLAAAFGADRRTIQRAFSTRVHSPARPAGKRPDASCPRGNSKFKYEQQKREAEARKKQKTIEIKEIKFRPGTDTHDYDVKMRSVLKFLEEGDKVKVTLRFRGREMAHQDLGLDLLNRVRDDVGEAGKIESMPKLEGRQMVMMIAPR